MQPEPINIGDTIALVAPAYWSDRVEETRDALIERISSPFSFKFGSKAWKAGWE